jgi:hypothetical protein
VLGKDYYRKREARNDDGEGWIVVTMEIKSGGWSWRSERAHGHEAWRGVKWHLDSSTLDSVHDILFTRF